MPVRLGLHLHRSIRGNKLAHGERLIQLVLMPQEFAEHGIQLDVVAFLDLPLHDGWLLVAIATLTAALVFQALWVPALVQIRTVAVLADHLDEV